MPETLRELLGWGGEVLMDEAPPPLPTTDVWIEAVKERANVRNRVRDCQSCELSSHTTPVPYSGPAKPQYAIVGEAPGRREAALGEPFVGPAGRLMRAMLEEAGLESDRALWMNTVSCFPSGTPADHQVTACRGNLESQLALSPNPWVLLVGQIALSSFRECLAITKAKGAAYYRDDRLYFSVWHPAYILRDRSKREETVEDLKGFAFLVDGELPAKFTLSEQCQWQGCGETVDIYDDEAVPWCARHWEERGWLQWTEEERVAEGRRLDAVRVAKAHIAHQKGRRGKAQTSAKIDGKGKA